MAKRQPDSRLVPEGKVLKDEYAKNYQFSAHISEYHKEWIDKKRETENGFSASKRLRQLLDLMILNDSEVDIPQECFIEEGEQENTALEGIEVFKE
jgi:hypothetical protein